MSETQVEGPVQEIARFGKTAMFTVQDQQVWADVSDLGDQSIQEFWKLQRGAFVCVRGTDSDEQDVPSIKAIRLRVLSTTVLVATPTKEFADISRVLAQQISDAGWRTALHPHTTKLRQQLLLAAERGIDVTVVPQPDGTAEIRSGEYGHMTSTVAGDEVRTALLKIPAISSMRSGSGCLTVVAEMEEDRARRATQQRNSWRYRKTT